MQKIERTALMNSGLAGGCAKNSRANASNTVYIIIQAK
ncbi:hypothetical protein AWB78_01827 [Caballeronia calidae]|uniref:Lipoprotein n=1 Tax=Caballeronia calidae TaxID=1777139 RepID=A0A158AMT3_9BURK|nr:hypothetical protein AWB78_01827 [Caballeronia calidae]